LLSNCGAEWGHPALMVMQDKVFRKFS
jgi:hypothetical protein